MKDENTKNNKAPFLKEDSIREMIEIMKKHNMKISIDGCGCCGSPSVKLQVNGKLIADHDEFTIDMFSNKDPD